MDTWVWRHAVVWCVVVLTAAAGDGGGAAADMCYTPSGVLGIVVATFLVTVAMGAAAGAVLWCLWRKRRGWTGRCLSYATDKVSSHPAAFDNVYFREEDEEKGTKFTFTGSITNSKNGTKKIKTNPFSSVFNNHKKHKAMDDSCIAAEPERTTVSLKGHDFTGLGFNICGNMRDGIYVKDVLHRGPAIESGKIKAGDKILHVTVSFANIVYEDALTILSYASPYDVRLELQRAPDKSQTSSPGRRLASSSFSNNGHRLFHPLYRSQSIDDLTQIDKDHPKGGSLTMDAVDKPQDELPITGSLNERMLASAMFEEGVFRISSARTRRNKKADRVTTGSLRAHRTENFLPIEPQDVVDLKTGSNSGFMRKSTKSKNSSFKKSNSNMKKEADEKANQASSSNLNNIHINEALSYEPAEKTDGIQHQKDNSAAEHAKRKGSTEDKVRSSLRKNNKDKTSQPQDSPKPTQPYPEVSQNNVADGNWKAPEPPTKNEPSLGNGIHSEIPRREVIEISERELDGVMMSHSQFLARKAAASGTKRTEPAERYIP